MSAIKQNSNELALIDLLLNMDLAEEHPESFYHQFLETAIRLIPESRYGTVSLISGKEWKYVASVGHQLEVLLTLPLEARWDLSSGELMEVNEMESKHQTQFPPEIAKKFMEAVRKTSATLIGAYHLPGGDRVTLALDIPFGSPGRFSDGSKKIFQALLKFAGKHQRLVKDERDLRIAYSDLQDRTNGLEMSYQEISNLSEKLRQVLNLAYEMGQGVMETRGYFDLLLQSALSTIEQADYGTLSLIEKGHWKFMSAVGHDQEKLKTLSLSGKWLPPVKDGVDIRPVLKDFQKSLPAEFFLELKEAWKASENSLVALLEVSGDLSIFITLDSREGSDNPLPQSSKHIFESFARLANSFLKLKVHTEAIKRAYLGFAEKLSLLAEAHDADTAQHNKRVAELSGYLAREAGLEDVLSEEIETFSILHDIGKIFIDTSIIKNSNELDEEDYEIIKKHTTLSESLLDDPFFKTAKKIAVCHHERWDGSGYPNKLKGEEIPIEAQIVSIADVYDAIRSKRSYKDAIPAKEVLRIMKEGDSRIHPGMFNPKHLELLESRLEEIERRFYITV